MPRYFVDVNIKISVPLEADSEASARSFIEKEVATDVYAIQEVIVDCVAEQLTGNNPDAITVDTVRPMSQADVEVYFAHVD